MADHAGGPAVPPRRALWSAGATPSRAGDLVTRPHATRPLSDARAAQLVHRSRSSRGPEPQGAQRTPSAAQLRRSARSPTCPTPLRHRPLHRHDRRGDPVGGAQVGLRARPAARGRGRRVVVAHVDGGRQRRLVRAVPDAPALPLLRAVMGSSARTPRSTPTTTAPSCARSTTGRQTGSTRSTGETASSTSPATCGARSARGSPAAGGTRRARLHPRGQAAPGESHVALAGVPRGLSACDHPAR